MSMIFLVEQGLGLSLDTITGTQNVFVQRVHIVAASILLSLLRRHSLGIPLLCVHDLLHLLR